MQEKVSPVIYEMDKIENRAVLLLKGLRLMEIPIIYTQQYTKGLGMTEDVYFEAGGNADKKYFDKRTFSCCANEAIMNEISGLGRKNILLMGIESHVCVLQTGIDLKAAGYQPVLVTDAVGSRSPRDKEAAIRRAMQEGITVTSTEAILFELMITSDSPKFCSLSSLIKQN